MYIGMSQIGWQGLAFSHIANCVVDHVQERDTYRKTLAPKDFHRRGGEA